MIADTPLTRSRSALERNGFEVFFAADPKEARSLVLEQILPGLSVQTVSWGDSLTLHAATVLGSLAERPDIELIRTFEEGAAWRDLIERRRRALLSDVFFTGTNAVTETGALVNLDMIGNRVAALAFGPKKVIVLAGRNKIVPDLEAAMDRIRAVAAPQNAARHGFATPCAASGRCRDCRSPQRICNTWTVTERCHPRGRIKVLLIDRDLGL